LDYALQLGADYVATGHYAQIDRSSGESKLLKGLDENKDQTYFLSQLSSDVLDKVMFPLGDIDKSEVRDIAEKYDLATAKKKESILYVEQGYHHEALYSDALVATGMNWVNGIPENKTFTSYAKCRYRQEDTKVFVTVLDDDSVRVEFEESQRAITPGQELVL